MMPSSVYNGHKVIRAGCKKPSPFLKSQQQLLAEMVVNLTKAGRIPKAVDIGCGNGRNSDYVKGLGFETLSFDRRPDYGYPIDLETQDLPVFTSTVNLVLVQYVLMFIHPEKLPRVLDKIFSICDTPAYILVEVFNAKDSHFSSLKVLEFLMNHLADMVVKDSGFKVYKRAKYRMLIGTKNLG